MRRRAMRPPPRHGHALLLVLGRTLRLLPGAAPLRRGALTLERAGDGAVATPRAATAQDVAPMDLPLAPGLLDE
eukprot:10291630-Alexandrium_andersonii.AAC.1